MPVDLVDNLLDIAAGSARPAPPPPPPVKQSPLGQALSELTNSGAGLTGDQEKNLSEAWQKGQVGLVRIARPHTVVGAFANLDEVKNYTALTSGGEAPPALAQRYQELKAAEDSGTTLFFPLQGDKVMGFLPVRTHDNWMRTDAAGAAILLARGEKLRCVDADGRTQELGRNGHLEASQASPEQVSTVKLLDQLAGQGVLVMPNIDYPDDMLVTDYGGKYWSDIETQWNARKVETAETSPVLAHKKMLEDLSEGRSARVLTAGDMPHYPSLLTLEELKLLSEKRGQTSYQTFRLETAGQNVNKAGGIMFIRHTQGDFKGALLKATPEQMVVALNSGHEAAILTPGGDMVACNNPEQFLTESYRAVGSERDFQRARQFVELEQRGCRIWGPAGGNSTRAIDPVEANQLLSAGTRIFLEQPDGQLKSLNARELDQLAPLQKVDRPRIDPSVPKTNLFLVYHHPLHDPTGKFIYYDDAVLKLKEQGSSEQTDVVMMHADLFAKNSLRMDYVQPGQLEPLKRLSPSTSMGDAKTFEDFVYNAVKDFPDRNNIRLMVFGHGGAELGVVDDLKGDRVANIPVGDFAQAISSALDRITQETGKRPKIQNLVMASCLMANTSLVDELARRGDVEVLSASPENLLDELYHKPTLDYMNDPTTADADSVSFGKKMVEVAMQATGFSEGKANRRSALIYGSYDLDPKKNEAARQALEGFFEACLANPGCARDLRDVIQHCPTYNIHPAGGPGIGSTLRDVIQVAQRTSEDRRLPQAVREAGRQLADAVRAQVISQETTQDYEGREGPSLNLPLTPHEYPFRQGLPTDLLQTTRYTDFLKLIMSVGDQRSAYEIAESRLYQEVGRQNIAQVEKLEAINLEQVARTEQEFLTSKQPSTVDPGLLARLSHTVKGVAGGVVGALVGGALGLASGVVAGGFAGATGRSLDQDYSPNKRAIEQALNPPVPSPDAEAQAPAPAPTHAPAAKEPKKAETIAEARKRYARIANPAMIAPAETPGLVTHRKLAGLVGHFLAGLVGAPVGAITGALAGLLTGAAVGAVEKAQEWAEK